MPYCIQHFSHLAVSAFLKHHFDIARVGVGKCLEHMRGKRPRERPTIDVDTGAQPGEIRRIRGAFYRCEVALVNVISRVGQPLDKLTVIREKHEALGRHVQATNRP